MALIMMWQKCYRISNTGYIITYCIPRSTIHNVFISSRRGLGLCGEFEQLCCHWRSGRRLPRRPYWGFGWDRTNFQTASNSELSYQDKPNYSFHNMTLTVSISLRLFTEHTKIYDESKHMIKYKERRGAMQG